MPRQSNARLEVIVVTLREATGGVNEARPSGREVVRDGGSKLVMKPFFVLNGLSFVYRRPMFAVSVGVIFQSSCM
jgi:hypothetical protein